MENKRTDLALESAQIWREAEKKESLPGVEQIESQREGISVTTVKITSAEGAQALGKPMGTYITLHLADLLQWEKDALLRAAKAIAAELSPLLPESGPVLVAGLGNRSITPDAVGPLVHDHTVVTRHLVEREPEQFGAFRAVAALSAGVLGTTGMESGELLQSVVEKIHPVCVVAVDALAARDLDRVCATIQIADTGIVPGSGVGNSRAALNKETMGVPVIAIGVPTVVDAATLAADLLEKAGLGHMAPEALSEAGRSLMVTPRDIDSRVAELSKLVGYGINLALQPGLSLEDMELFLS